MRSLLAAGVLGLGFLTVGCGGSLGEAKSAPSPSSPYAQQGYASGSQPGVGADAPMSEPSGSGSVALADAPQRAPASAPKKSAGAADEPSPAPPEPSRRETAERRDRPGLGTEWGETRSSRVREMTFERDTSDPTATIALHYNDRDGARALAAFRDTRPVNAGSVTALGGSVRVTIEDENGSPLDTVRIADRTVVVGSAGQRYNIVLTNRTGRRFEAVASVDGLDVMTGRAASFDQRGYILLPFATVKIEGFRQSERAVAAFRFSKVAESYAAQTGSARNVGVIGVALFRERGDRAYDAAELDTRDTASPFPGEGTRFARPPR